MKHTNNRGKTAATCAGGMLCLILLAAGAHGQDNKTNPVAAKPAPPDAINVTVGSFNVVVPTAWTAFASGEAASLRSQYLEKAEVSYLENSQNEIEERPAGVVGLGAWQGICAAM